MHAGLVCTGRNCWASSHAKWKAKAGLWLTATRIQGLCAEPARLNKEFCHAYGARCGAIRSTASPSWKRFLLVAATDSVRLRILPCNLYVGRMLYVVYCNLSCLTLGGPSERGKYSNQLIACPCPLLLIWTVATGSNLCLQEAVARPVHCQRTKG